MNKKRNDYIKRLAEQKIEDLLKISGALLISGPKWSGKTFISNLFSKDVIQLQTIEVDKLSLSHVKTIFDNSQKPLLVDEWQLFPKIWDQVRVYVDNKNEKGEFILTGSSSPVNNDKITHSGAGRISRIYLSNLSIYELLQDTQDSFISLINLFNNNQEISCKTDFTFEKIIQQMINGFWPENIAKEIDSSLTSKNYVESIIHMDTKKMWGINNDSHHFHNILRSLSRLNGSQLKYSTILNDINNSISENTLRKYINVIESLFLIKYLYPWQQNNFRSKTIQRTTPKMYLFDPSIGLSLLGIKNSNMLLKDLNTLGLYFETLVINNLMIYCDYIDANISFYRDNNGFEIDAIIELDYKRWAAIEIKLGEEKIEEAARNLNKFNDKFDDKHKPTFMAIITSSKYAYKRDDGIYVIPLGCLKP